jgi:proteasome lid subunit RPN8/RPN11
MHSERLVAADFDRAIDATYFDGFRQGVFERYEPRRQLAGVEPLFTADSESARATGFRVIVPREDGEFTKEFDLKYFAARAGRQRAALRRDRELPAETALYYALAAYLDDTVTQPSSRGALTLGDPAVEIPVRTGAPSAAAVREAWDDPQPTDLPVIMARSALEDACDEARRHPDREIGGLILGHLRRDESGEIFVEATCLASSEGTTESSQTSVTFTADSFAKARRLVELRASSGAEPEIVVGWYHSHPFRYCAECPLPTPPECLEKVLFYSEDDIQLMETTFYQPFMIGLLVAIEPRIEASLGHLPVKLFGWLSGGGIGPRGFEVVG